jgi:tRNA1Val (adenine37-N6)-methyltransferase
MSEETLDALFHGKVKLFQSRNGYRFSLDALLLAYFVCVQPHETVVDLGTGNGVIPLVLANLHSQISITGIELQSGMAERAERNVKLNGLEGRVQIRCGDVRAIDAIAPPESVDAVVCNPPFRQSSSGRISPNDEKRIARHEIHAELGDFLAAATFLLRLKGRMTMVYSARRTVDLLASMRLARVEPKRLRMVHSFADTGASLVLVEGIKGGQSGIEILPPLIVYRAANRYSAEVAAQIAGERPPSRSASK